MGLLRSPSQLLKKNRPAKKEGEAAEAEAEAETEAVAKPIIPPAPSATELLLRSDREKSQSAYQRAQKAEAAYRAKKNSERAKNDYQSSKSHLTNSCRELKMGIKTAFSSVRTSPAILKDKHVNKGNQVAVKKAEREEEKRKKLDAKLKKVREQQAKLEGENHGNNDNDDNKENMTGEGEAA